MNSDTSSNVGTMGLGGGTTSGMGSTGMSSTGTNDGRVQQVAQKAHDTVDRMAQTLSSSSEKMMGWQEEYGEMAREQIRANPLAVVAGAFFVGYLFAKITR